MTHPKILEWIASAPGRNMNPDSAYGQQCVDLADQFAQDLTGVSWAVSLGGVQGAKQLLDVSPDAYWIRTDNNPNDPNLIPKQGDMVVFGGSRLNQWGHVAIVESADQNGMWVVQQDGFAPPLNADGYSVKPAHRAWLPYDGPGTGMVSGWLTLREEKIIGGYKAPQAPKPAPTLGVGQRAAGPMGAKYRPFPSTQQKETQIFDPYASPLNFIGYVHGESVEGDDRWLKGISKGFVHVSAVEPPNVDGLPDLTPKAADPIASNQRRIGTQPANQREAPTTSALITAELPANEVYTFSGYTHGEKVGDGPFADIWFKGANRGHWIHSSTTTNPSTDGLPNLNTAPVIAADEKVVGSTPANQRSAPSVDAPVVDTLDSGKKVKVLGYAKGSAVGTSSIWFQVAATKNWIHASTLTDGSIGALPDITPAKAPSKPIELPTVPDEYASRAPVPPASKVSPDGLKTVTDWIPAHYDNYGDGNFPADPTGVVLHTFGLPDVHLDSVINYFQMSEAQRKAGNPRAGVSSAGFGIEGGRVVQFVELKNRAYGAGKDANHMIQIETYGGQDELTISMVNALLAELAQKYGHGFVLHRHKEFMNTECGNLIDLSKYNGGYTPAKQEDSDVENIEAHVDAIKEILTKMKEKK